MVRENNYFGRSNRCLWQLKTSIYTRDIYPPGHNPTKRVIEANYRWAKRLQIPDYVLSEVELQAKIEAAIDKENPEDAHMFKALLTDLLAQPCPN